MAVQDNINILQEAAGGEDKLRGAIERATPEQQAALTQRLTSQEPINPIIQDRPKVNFTRKFAQTPVEPTQAPVDFGADMKPIYEQKPEPVVEPTTPTEPVTPVTPVDTAKPLGTTEPVAERQTKIPVEEKTRTNTVEETMTAIESGANLDTDPKTKSFAKQAQYRLDKVSKFSVMTPTQLAGAISRGEVSEQLQKDLTRTNPELFAQAQEKATTKSNTEVANNIQSTYMDTESEFSNTALSNLDKRLAESEYPENLRQNTYAQYPEITELRNDINRDQTEVKNIQRDMRQTLEEYTKAYPGVPQSQLMSMVRSANNELTEQLYTLQDSINTNTANLGFYIDQAEAQIDEQIDYANRMQDFAFSMYDVESAAEIREEDIMREEQRYQQEIERAEIEYARAIEREDYEYARNLQDNIALMQEERGYNESIAMDKALLELGVDPTYLSQEEKYQQLATENRNMLAFEEYIQSAKGQIDLFNAQKGDWVVDVDKGIKYNRDTGEYEMLQTGADGQYDLSTVMSTFNENGQNLLSTPDGTVLPTRLGQVSPQNAQIRGKECAEYMNDILGKKIFGNTYNEKLTQVNSNSGVIGSVAIWQPEGSGIFGHVGMIVGDAGDSWLIKSSNYEAGTITTDKIPKSAIGGYHIPDNVMALYQQDNTLQSSDVSGYNNPTFKPQDLTGQEKQRYQQFLDEKQAVMDNKESDINDILRYSMGGRGLTDSSVKSLTKFDQALTQLSAIQKEIKKIDTGPILGRIRQLNPYDTDAQVLARSLTSLIPNLARGVYGEVGVLTDNDIRLYSQTVPNLTQTSDVNKAILALTLDTVAGGYKKQLATLAASGYDVSGFTGQYDSIKSQADSLRAELGMGDQQSLLGEDDISQALSVSANKSAPYKTNQSYFNQ